MNMIRHRMSPRAVASVLAAMLLAVPAYADVPSAKPDYGLTRDTFTDTSNSPHAPAPAPAAPRPRTKRTRLDSKDFLSVHHANRHHERVNARDRHVVSAPLHPQRRRNPVTSFVYWWNGFVLKTFHTKFGTVLLGTVGAKS